MKTPKGIPRMAPIRKPQAAEPKSQPIRMQIPITAMVVPIRTEPAPARLSFGVWDGSIGGASIAEFVTYEIRLVQRKLSDFVRWNSGGATLLVHRLVPAAEAEATRVRRLDDLQHVDDIDREHERDERDRDHRERLPWVPDPALPERDEAGRECRAGQGRAPHPHDHGRSALGVAAS